MKLICAQCKLNSSNLLNRMELLRSFDVDQSSHMECRTTISNLQIDGLEQKQPTFFIVASSAISEAVKCTTAYRAPCMQLNAIIENMIAVN